VDWCITILSSPQDFPNKTSTEKENPFSRAQYDRQLKATYSWHIHRKILSLLSVRMDAYRIFLGLKFLRRM
jgi:hypothetical protein